MMTTITSAEATRVKPVLQLILDISSNNIVTYKLLKLVDNIAGIDVTI